MRTSAFPLVTMLLFAMPAILQAAEPDSNAKLPSRKAGLWELKTSMDEGNGPIDAAISADGRGLFVLNAGSNSITSFAIARDGSLAAAGSVTGLPAGSNGLAAN